MNETNIFFTSDFFKVERKKKSVGCRAVFFGEFSFVIYLTRRQQPRYSREYGLEMMGYIQPSPQKSSSSTNWSRPIVTLRLALDFDDDCIYSVLLQKMARKKPTLPVISLHYIQNCRKAMYHVPTCIIHIGRNKKGAS